MRLKDVKNILRISLILAKTNFKLRIEGSYLGILWYLLNPLALFLILLLVKLTAFSDVYIPYFPLYLLIGVSAFNFLKQIITQSIDVISDNPEYIKSINKIKPESLVIASAIQAIFSHAFEFVILVVVVLFFQLNVLGLIIYPLILLIFFLCLLGFAFMLATLGVYINDLKNIWAIASQLILLGTPIFYTISAGSLMYSFNQFNPLYHFIEINRAIIIDYQLPSIIYLALCLVVSISILLIGIFVFNRHKKKFAELL